MRSSDSYEMSAKQRMADGSLANEAPAFYEQLADGGEEEEETSDEFPPLFFVPSKRMLLALLVALVLSLLSLFQWNDTLQNWPAGCRDNCTSSCTCFGYAAGQSWYESGFVKLGSIPLISVIFTFFHIWLALWLTFYPLEFVGIFQLPNTNVGAPGWQGIIPSKGEKMARMSVQLMTTQLINVREQFAKLDAAVFSSKVEGVLFDNLSRISDATYHKHFPTIWGALPQHLKDEMLLMAHENTKPCVVRIMEDFKEQILEVFDIEEFVVAFFAQNKDLLCRMFIKCGRKELCFIRNSGATMGGIFGLIQMIVWLFWHPAEERPLHPDIHAYVVFPVIGLVVGTLTNWIALKIIFEPVDPVDIGCGMKMHGLFLRRQHEVAKEYGRMVATQVLTAKNILDTMQHGPNADRVADIMVSRIGESMDEYSKLAMPLLHLTIGADMYEELKEEVVGLMLETMPQTMGHAEEYMEEALDMERTLTTRMQALPCRDFEGLLHPVFQEDEWKLVLMGGALGLLIGLVQAFFIN